MKALCLQHVPFEGPAFIADILGELRIPLEVCRVFAGEPLPGHGSHGLVFIMGGPMSVHDDAKHRWLVHEKRWIAGAVDSGVLIIGVCLGAQLIAHALGAGVYRNKVREIGWFQVQRTAEPGTCASVLKAMPDRFTAFHWHGETFDVPRGAIRLMSSEACENQAFLYRGRTLGMQFHLESTEASIGALIRHCSGDLEPGSYVQSGKELESPLHLDRCHEIMKNIIKEMTDSHERE